MKLKTIYLVRHSQQLKLIGKINSGESTQIRNEKITLSTIGEQLAKKLSEIEEIKNIDELWSSNYVRTIATAKYISELTNLPINIDERLNERKLGELDALEKLGAEKENSFTVEQLLEGDFKNIDGESRNEVSERMENFMSELLSQDEKEKILIVSHGAAIKFYIYKWCELDKNNILCYKGKEIVLGSPSIVKLQFCNKELTDMSMVEYNN